MTLFKMLWVLSLSLLLTACGFQFRGQSQALRHLPAIYLQTDSAYSQLTRDTRNMLTSAGATLVANPKLAAVTLSVQDQGMQMQSTGYGFSNQVSNAIVTYKISYSLTGKKGKVLFDPHVITGQETFTINTNQPLSSDMVPDYILAAARQDVVSQLLNQLNSEQVKTALKHA